MSLARNTASLAALALVAGSLVATGGATAAFAAADPVAGGQTAGDSLFPNQGNSGYDALHYDINFAVDVTTATVNGAVGTTNLRNATTTIDAKTTDAPLSSYSLDFQGSTGNLAASTYDVDSVTVNGVPATFSRIETSSTSSALIDNHKLIITPATPVDGTFTTVVKTHGAPVIHFDTDGSAEGWNNTTDGATFVNQPVGSMTLFPNNNTPRDKATYTFTIDAPTMLKTSNFAQAGGKPYKAGVASNGELVSRTPSADGTRTTWVWNQTKQMASELSMVSIGRYDIYESDIVLASGRTLHEWSFVDPATTVAQQTATQVSRAQFKSLLDFYESKWGPYPGNSTGVVTDIVPSTINYALETQDRPFFPNSASGSFYHEIAHQWWGDNVSPTDWNDITLNEGPATYAPSQFGYESSGTTNTTTEQAIYNSWNTTAASSSTFTVPSAAMTLGSQLFGSQVYQRGAMALEALRTSIGAANYEKLMKQYQQTYGGGQITGRRTAAFEAMAESISGRDLTSFFQTWWFVSGKPAWPVKFNFSVAGPTSQVNAGDAASYTLSVRNTGKVAMPADATKLTVDLADILDDATIGTLPANTTLDGTTLTWSVPATNLAATASIAIPVTVNPSATGTLKAVVRASTLGGTALDATSTAAIGVAPISPAPVPTITGGSPVVGAELTADTTGWAEGTTFAYQWFIDGTPVVGATGATYTPTFDVFGLGVTVKVTGTKSGFNPTSQTSAATASGVKAAQPVATPTVSGTPKIGSKLTVEPGTWQAGTVFTYQWRANGANITGATGPVYSPAVAGQVGQNLDVIVTGTKAGYTTTSRTSATTSAVTAGDALESTPTPTLPATPKVGTALIAVPGFWDDGVTLTYTWQANGTNITGASAVSYTPIAAQLGQALTVTVTGTKAGYAPVSRVSAPGTVEAGTQVLQPTPTITGTPRAGTAVTGAPGTWDANTTRTYKWLLDGVVIDGATAVTYTPTIDQIGKSLAFEVTSTRAGYTTVVKTSAGKTIVGLAQTLTPTPTISGDVRFPNTLTVVPGTWDADTTLTQQWFVDGVAIEGATALDYTLALADIGKAITVAVTSTKPTYETATTTSAATAAVAAGDLTLTPTPTISGTPKVGVELTAIPGTWDVGTTLTYQWSDDEGEITGATASTYTVSANEAGAAITVAVTGTKAGYTPVTKTSDATDEVELGDLAATPVPTISGTAKVDVELTAVSGTWTEGTTLSYQWFADDEAIDGATAETFTPGGSLAGTTITVAVTGTKSGYTTVTKTSAETAEVADGDFVLAPVPTISGTAKVDVELTAVAGDWDAGTELAYQWLLNGAPIDGATDVTFTPPASFAGSIVMVSVTGTKAGYTPVTKTSVKGGPVADGDLVDTPVPTISGTAKVDVQLAALAGDWDNSTALAYQWFVDGVAVEGATNAVFIPTAADAGAEITVSVTGTKAGYTSVTMTSDPTETVSSGDLVDTPTPLITGSAKVGGVLTAIPGTWDAGTRLLFEWFVDGELVADATGRTFTPGAAELGSDVKVSVTGVKVGYGVVVKTSESVEITLGDLVLTPRVLISGAAQVGRPLKATAGKWDAGTKLTYAWLRDGKTIAGATTSVYTLRVADHAHKVSVRVTGSKAGYQSVSTTSVVKTVAAGTQVRHPQVKISGTAKVGKTLTAKAGVYDAGVTKSFTWYANGTKIGTDKSTIKLLSKYKGDRITVKVTAKKAGYATVTSTSSKTAKVTK